MAIISFMSTKGGTGKSLLTRLMATEMAESGNVAVDLICADHPQHSTFKWFELVKNFPGFPERLRVHRADNAHEIMRHLEDAMQRNAHSIQMIDVGGYEGAHIHFAMMASDISIVPARPHAEEIREAINVCVKLRTNVPDVTKTLRVVLNDVGPLEQNLPSFREALAMLEDAQLNYFDTRVIHRNPYVRFSNNKPSLQAMQDGEAKRNKSIDDARDNIRELMMEVVSIIQKGKAA